AQPHLPGADLGALGVAGAGPVIEVAVDDAADQRGRGHGTHTLLGVLAGTDAFYDIVGGVADDVIEVLHRPAAPADPQRIALDPLEDRIFVQQFLVRLHLGTGQQTAGIEVAGQLLVEPAHRQVPHLGVFG